MNTTLANLADWISENCRFSPKGIALCAPSAIGIVLLAPLFAHLS